MSRRKDKDAEFEAECQREHERRVEQQNCYHFNGHPTKWYWHGQVEEMTCADCGLTRWFESTEDHGDEL